MRFRAAEQRNELNKRRANLNSVKEQAIQQQKEADNGTLTVLSFPGLWGVRAAEGLAIDQLIRVHEAGVKTPFGPQTQRVQFCS